MNKISGVYKITNIITDEFYIGSSKNIKNRWAGHKCASTWIKRPGMKLYQAFNKYGVNNFKFEVIEETNMLKEREQYYIDLLKPSYNNIRASGIDIERCRESHRQAAKEWLKAHHMERMTYCNDYDSRLCLYESKVITLSALRKRFYKQ